MPNQINSNQSVMTPCIVCNEPATESRMWQVCPLPQAHEGSQEHPKELLCKTCVPHVREHMQNQRMNKCFFKPQHVFDEFGGAPLDPQIKHMNEGMELPTGETQIELDPKPFTTSSEDHIPQISSFNDLRIG